MAVPEPPRGVGREERAAFVYTGEKRRAERVEGGRRDRVEEYYTCRCSGVLTPNSFFNVT